MMKNPVRKLRLVKLPKLTRNEKSILSGSRISGISQRAVDSMTHEGGSTTVNLVFPKERTRIIEQRQEDVITELLYPNGLTLGALFGVSKLAYANPYTRETTMMTLGRLMSKGIVTINKNSRLVLDPAKITLINHSPVADGFEDCSMVGIVDE